MYVLYSGRAPASAMSVIDFTSFSRNIPTLSAAPWWGLSVSPSTFSIGPGACLSHTRINWSPWSGPQFYGAVVTPGKASAERRSHWCCRRSAWRRVLGNCGDRSITITPKPATTVVTQRIAFDHGSSRQGATAPPFQFHAEDRGTVAPRSAAAFVSTRRYHVASSHTMIRNSTSERIFQNSSGLRSVRGMKARGAKASLGRSRSATNSDMSS